MTDPKTTECCPEGVGPLDEAAILQPADQPMATGFGLEVQCLLHLLDGGSGADLGLTFADEDQEFMLLLREHRECRTTRSISKNEATAQRTPAPL